MGGSLSLGPGEEVTTAPRVPTEGEEPAGGAEGANFPPQEPQCAEQVKTAPQGPPAEPHGWPVTAAPLPGAEPTGGQGKASESCQGGLPSSSASLPWKDGGTGRGGPRGGEEGGGGEEEEPLFPPSAPQGEAQASCLRDGGGPMGPGGRHRGGAGRREAGQWRRSEPIAVHRPRPPGPLGGRAGATCAVDGLLIKAALAGTWRPARLPQLPRGWQCSYCLRLRHPEPVPPEREGTVGTLGPGSASGRGR